MKNAKIKFKLITGFSIVCIVMLISSIVAGYSVSNLYFASEKAIVKSAPLVDAAMEIKLEATTAHLWFEEIMTFGGRSREKRTVPVYCR